MPEPESSAASFTIAGRRIGPGEPCYVIAEAGVNHDGEVDLAHRLIDVAAAAGADAVKFQTFRPEELVAPGAGSAPYQRERGAPTQEEMLRRLVLPDAAWRELAAHASERDLAFLSTAFDLPSLDLLVELEVPALKVPSGELDHLALIREIASRGLPILLSTGLGSLDEVAAAVEAAAPAPALALLHCVTAYPAPIDASNLRAMVTMAETFAVPVGWSDHTEGPVTAIVAVALGASILEKHFTVDRSRSGPDHAASADPDLLASYVAAVRDAESSLGDGVKRPAEPEIENLRFARRSYHAVRDLAEGATIAPEDVRLLRPAVGLAPGDSPVGRSLRRSVAAGEALKAMDLR